ncbi:MAG: class I SAM-dependent methyltransferase [Desulfovibrio sp.]|nr:class I SAM-dependent methyltransferase [Desulfovibrio sp.]
MESFKKLISLPPQGSLLDFGAGTGAFLRVFHNDHPEWELTAIEPGGGFAQISDGLPLKQAYNAPFYNLDVRECFDAVVVMSVLEHLTNPLHALHWIRERLKPDGVLLMQHPNFAAMPGDLLCVDHINKLTPAHTAAVCGYIGLAPVAAQESGSMFELVCRQSSIPSGNFAWPAAENRKIAKSCEAVAQATIRAVKQAVESARAKNGKAAIFGSSPVGNMSVYILGCEKDVACYVDENSNNWGRIQDGIPITSPAEMEKFGVSDLVIAISPVYWETVSKKMRAYPVTVHVPEIFTSGECHES